MSCASKRIIVAITGASGSTYAVTLLRALRNLPEVETHLVISAWGERTLLMETGLTPRDLETFCAKRYDVSDMSAAISSGSFRTHGMVVVPCSMKTLGAIANGLAADLIARAADVTIKEGRRLILVPRETPLSLVHLENMVRCARSGAVILPPMPAFYGRPETIQDIVDHTVSRILDRLGFENELSARWTGPVEA